MCSVNIGSVVAQAGMDVPLTVLRELSIGLADLDVGLRAQRHLAPPPAVVGGGGYRLGSGGTPGADTLQHLHRDEIYAVGDSARFVPLPRIGMHGVRQGPILHACLLTRLRNQPLPVYESQRRALSILDLGDGVGLAVRGRRRWVARRTVATQAVSIDVG